jgi:O-antigen/teichoic acid export membrane protein
MISQVARVVTLLVMARYVSPEEFGLYMLVQAYPGLLVTLGDWNLPYAMVQNRKADERTVIDTAFAIGGGLILFYSLAYLGCGALLAWQRQNSQIMAIAAIVAATNGLQIIYNLQMAVLNRRLAFRAQARQNLIFSFVSAVTGIVMALMNFGIFAIACQGLAAQLVANLVLLKDAPLRWPRHFSMKVAKEFFLLGGKGTLAGYLSSVQSVIITLVIHTMIPDRNVADKVVGAWGRAVQIQQLFAQNILSSFSKVSFPMFAATADNMTQIRRIYNNAYLIIGLYAAFTTVWLFVGVEPLVAIFLGPKWVNDVPQILAIIALAVPAGGLLAITNDASYALGRTGALVYSALIDMVLFACMLGAFWGWGIQGIALTWTISRYVLGVGTAVQLEMFLKSKPLSAILRVVGLFATAAAAGWGMWYCLHYLFVDMKVLIGFTLSSVIALAGYIVLVFATQRSIFSYAFRLSRH